MTPRVALALAGLAILIGLAAGLYWKGRADGAARQRPKTEAALAQAAVAGLEARGERESAQRVEVVVRRREAAQVAVARLTEDALTSEDAHAPLDPDRLARLRALDLSLCLAAPELGGCAETPDARGSGAPLRPAPPSRRGDPG